MRTRLNEFDALRGIAVLMVVGFHYTTRYQELYGHSRPLLFELSLGRYGVQFFLILSGFAIFMTLQKTHHYLNFIVSRFARLYPAYWAAVVLTFSAVSIFSLPGRETNLCEAVVNLSMLQTLFHVPNVDSAYWILPIILIFYFYMIVLYILGLLPQIEIIATVWLTIMVLSKVLEMEFGIIIPGIIKMSLLISYANLFLAGIMFYKFYFGSKSLKIHFLIGTCLVVQFIIGGLTSGIVCSVFFGILYLCAFHKTYYLTIKPLVFLGSISYSLYLLHQNIGYIIMRGLYSHNFSQPSAICIALIASISLASVLTFVIENPAREAIRTHWNTISARRGMKANNPTNTNSGC
jgi:peptidoglycan/LPS O-acetylase OafA/YrhL